MTASGHTVQRACAKPSNACARSCAASAPTMTGAMSAATDFGCVTRCRDTRIGVGAFGPIMTRLAARLADEVVLNLASPQRVSQVRQQVDHHAAAAGRTPPHLTVWVPVAVRPGAAALRQLANQLAIYLAPTRLRRDVLRARVRRIRRARPQRRAPVGVGGGDSPRAGRAAGRSRYSGTGRCPTTGLSGKPAQTPSR